MRTSIPPLAHIDKILTEEQQVAGVKNTGHEIVFGDHHVFKYNKEGREIASKIEFVVHQLIRHLLPEDCIPQIELVVGDDPHNIEAKKIVGVAVTKVENFKDMTKVNVIELIAEIEGFVSTPPYRQKDPVLAEELREYFSHPEFGKARRIKCFEDYMAIVFIRYLLQEDDGHKGNYGFTFNEYKLCPVSELLLNEKPKKNNLYIEIHHDFISYVVATPVGEIGRGCISQEELGCDWNECNDLEKLQKFLPKILLSASKKGHTHVNPQHFQWYGIDFDMTLYRSIVANFNMVRMSQYGSAFRRFKLTADDIYNFPFLKHTIPGHYVGIEANTPEAQSLTPNPGRYTKADVHALRYLCEKPDFQIANQLKILQMIEIFLQFNVIDFENSLHNYTPDQLKELANVTDNRQVNFPHIVACAMAEIQASLYGELKRSPLPDSGLAKERVPKILDKFASKFQPYMGEQKFLDYKRQLCDQLANSCGKSRAIIFLEIINKMEADHYLHYCEGKMKYYAIQFAEICSDGCTARELEELVFMWSNHLTHNFITKSRDSHAVSRYLKNNFYNKMTTTYVTIRDIFLCRALDFRTRGHDMEAVIDVLMLSRSFIQSHSERPLNFVQRVQLHGSYVILGNYATVNFKNYFYSKQGLEKLLLVSIILAPIVVLKDTLCFSLQIIPLMLGLVARMPRRLMADFFRLTAPRDFFGKKLISSFGSIVWFISTCLHYAAKITEWLVRKITCPLISADEDSEWVVRRLQASTQNRTFVKVVGFAVYAASILTSCALYFALVKLMVHVLPVLGAGMATVVLAKALCGVCQPLGIYTLGLFAAGGIFLQKTSGMVGKNIFGPNIKGRSRHSRMGLYSERMDHSLLNHETDSVRLKL